MIKKKKKKKKDSIGWLTLNRPKKHNALSLDLINNIKKQLNIISKKEEIKVIVIKANGDSFCSGHEINDLIGEKYDIYYFQKIFSECTNMMQTLHEISQPVIASVHGVATAAGCQLVAACDLAVAEKNAKFATPGVKIGLFCSTPMVPLVRLIGRRRALDMLLTGRYVSAMEAKEFGLVNKVVSKDELYIETERLAKMISQYSRFILEYGKKTFYNQINLDESSAYDYATESIARNCLFEDAQEGMKAVLEKRKPKWKNR